MKTAILGGTFNPVHNGHLAIASTVYSRLAPDKILLVPAYDPPHKEETNLIPYEDRLQLVKLAVEPYSYLEASDLDYTPGRKSYSRHLVERLRTKYPGSGFFFIIGADNVPELSTWYDYRWLLDNVQFVAVTRPDFEIEKYRYLDYFEKITFIDMEPVAISSRKIRRMLGNNEDIAGLVPLQVKNYIEKHQLYRDKHQ